MPQKVRQTELAYSLASSRAPPNTVYTQIQGTDLGKTCGLHLISGIQPPSATHRHENGPHHTVLYSAPCVTSTQAFAVLSSVLGSFDWKVIACQLQVRPPSADQNSHHASATTATDNARRSTNFNLGAATLQGEPLTEEKKYSTRKRTIQLTSTVNTIHMTKRMQF